MWRNPRRDPHAARAKDQTLPHPPSPSPDRSFDTKLRSPENLEILAADAAGTPFRQRKRSNFHPCQPAPLPPHQRPVQSPKDPLLAQPGSHTPHFAQSRSKSDQSPNTPPDTEPVQSAARP